MIAKQFFISLFIAALPVFICNIAWGQKLTAQLSLPAAVNKGATCVVKINIIQSDVDGFMKFSQILPDGYTASELDSKGGDFRFENNEVKIIWLKASEQKAYTISYQLNIPTTVNGFVSLAGSLTYVTSANERKVYNIATKALTFITDNEIVPKKINTDKVIKATTTTTTNTITKNNIVNKKQPENSNIPELLKLYTVNNESSYSVQVGAFRKRPQLNGIPEQFIISKQEINRYYSGTFKTNMEAETRKKLMIDQGYKDAYIVILQPGGEPESSFIDKNWWQAVAW